MLQLPIGKKHASLTSISTDAAGRIFFTSFASGDAGVSVHELVRTKPVEFPERLSETGYFQDLGALQPADDFVAYTLNSPLWSDGLEKQRWVKIPEGTKIENAGDEATESRSCHLKLVGASWREPFGNELRWLGDLPFGLRGDASLAR